MVKKIVLLSILFAASLPLFAQYGYQGDEYGGCYAEEVIETYDKDTSASDIAEFLCMTYGSGNHRMVTTAKNVEFSITDYGSDGDGSSFTLNITARLADFTVTTRIEVIGTEYERILLSFYDYTEDRPGFTNRKYRLQYDAWTGDIIKDVRQLVKSRK